MPAWIGDQGNVESSTTSEHTGNSKVQCSGFPDHVEIGRIQGRQMVRLLPQCGSVLYLSGSIHEFTGLQT